MNNQSIYELNLRVVYYARVSTDNDIQTTSIKNQANFFEKFISSVSNWTLVSSYIDIGISGKSINNRINFKKMIRDGIDGKYDLILTKSVSRFARNTIDSIKYTDMLKERGIGVYFINDNINTFSSDSEFRLTLMASIAQDEIRKLSESVKFGLKQSIDRGVVLGNNNILGYKKDKGRLIIVDEEAKIIRDIYNIFVTGKYNYREVARIINGKYRLKMNSTSIKRILVNYKYKGFYCGKKSTIINYKLGKRKIYSQDEWIIYRDNITVPPIIDERIWNKVSMLINNKQRNRSKYNVFCYKHRNRCRYVVKKYKNNTYKYYMCFNCFSIKESLLYKMISGRRIMNVYVDKRDEYLIVYLLIRKEI